MTKQPHVFLIMADHLRFDCLSCYGDMKVDTPNLDALANESVVFDNAYCAAPLCGPTRNSMYTGKAPHTHGAIVNAEKGYAHVGPEHRTLYEALDDAGYAITHTGIQHCRTEPKLPERVPNADIDDRRSWNEYARSRGIPPGVGGYDDVKDTRVAALDFNGDESVIKRFPAPRRILYPHSADDFMDVFWSRDAAGKIADLDTSRPNYVETLFWAPHPPLMVPEPYYSMYPPESIEMPETVGEWYDGQPASLLLQSCAGMGAGSGRRDYIEPWSAYLGLVTMIDDCVGRVVEAIKAKGIWDESLVIFTQDHGELLGEHALCQKHCHYEAAAHIPLLVKAPRDRGVSRGAGMSRRAELISAIDYCPTICDYANATPPDGNQGVSYRSLVEDESSSSGNCGRAHGARVVEDAATNWRDRTFLEYNGDHGRNIPSRAVVATVAGQRWKYIYTHLDKDELYNLETDPNETQSRVEDEDCQEIRIDLRDSIGKWMKETGDFFELPGIDEKGPSLAERLRAGVFG